MLAIVLHGEGHRVLELGEGTALARELGQRWAGRPRPNELLVIADVRMPGLDALTVLGALAEPRPPFVLMTAFPGAAVHEAAAKLGALAVLDKPFDFEHMRSIVRAVALRASINRNRRDTP